MNNKKIIITGGCGFVGHHFVEHILKKTNWDIIIFDKLSYASNGYDRLRDIKVFPENQTRVKIFPINLTNPISAGVDQEVGKFDYLLHIAAESHVDNSIKDPVNFILNNVHATLNILEYARSHPEIERIINFSTDEVFGPAPEKYSFKEYEYHRPSNPYAASKSAQEAIGIAYANTYKLPIITTHSINIFGERQHPEKFIPMTIKKIINNETVTIHSNPDRTKAGSRFYIHARNVADAVLHILNLPFQGYNEFNIAGLEEIDNLTLAQMIAKIIGKDLKYELVDFHSSRPGHDLRYALDSTKLINSGYQYPKNFQESLAKTIQWTIDRKEDWL